MASIQPQPGRDASTPQATDVTHPENQGKAPFVPPKLTFVTPTLTKQGSVEKLTAGIIGTFS